MSNPEPKKILVVEDEGLIAMDLKRRLERFGYSVPAVAATAQDAIDLASAHLPDLVLMDIRLKGNKDGVEAAADVRKLDIPVIFLTAHADAATIERANSAGPYGYIVKPFGTTDFRGHIEVALEKHRSDRKLRRGEAWLSATLRSVSDAIIATDLDGNVELMNAEAERLTGWRLADAKGNPVVNIFSVVPLHTSDWGDRTLIPRRASKPFLIEGPPSPGPSEDCPIGRVIAFRDVTAQRETEGQMRRARQIETFGLMAGALAHDFNNLLTIILGRADTIQSDPRRACDDVGEIQRAAGLAANLGSRLLAGRFGEGAENKVFDLNRTIRTSAKILRQVLWEASCSLVLEIDNEPLLIYGDWHGFQRVLVNLAINARDAMPRGGQLTIGGSRSPLGLVQLTIDDTGTGMDAETRERIFEPFVTRKGSKGSGLGLQIVYSIVTRAGGTIEVESEPGCGTRFRILLPPAPAEPPVVKNQAVEEGPQPAGTILFVGDKRDSRALLRGEFENAGFETLEASSAQKALRLLERNGAAIDILIADAMPGRTGPDLARKCFAGSPQTRVLIVPAQGEDPFAGDDLFQYGRAEFVARPLRPGDLLAKVRTMMKSVA